LRKKSELNCETMPLHCLVRDGKTEEIEKYAERGGKLELTDNWGRTALLWALVHDRRAIAHRLLTLNASPNTQDENGISIFHHAVVAGKYDLADALLASGADIDGFNGNRYPETALHHCVMKNDPGGMCSVPDQARREHPSQRRVRLHGVRESAHARSYR